MEVLCYLAKVSADYHLKVKEIRGDEEFKKPFNTTPTMESMYYGTQRSSKYTAFFDIS